jgi:hypothetical protein
MKKPGVFIVCIVLLSVFIITACDGVYTSDYHYQSFEYRLQGIWETYSSTSLYYGSLIITSDKIIIEGYDQYPYPYYKEDPRRPFVDLPRGFRLDGYSEKIDNNRGIIYIENEKGDGFDEIPYRYDSEYDSLLRKVVEKLLFTFSSPKAENPLFETLLKIAD